MLEQLAALMNNILNFNSSSLLQYYSTGHVQCWPPTRNCRLEGPLKQVNSNENKGEFNWNEAFSFIVNKKNILEYKCQQPATEYMNN